MKYFLPLFVVATLTLASCSDGEEPVAKDAAPPPAKDAAAPQQAAKKLEPATLGEMKVQKFGNIYLGGQPTPEDFAAFKEAGGKTVISLRGEGESTSFDQAAVLADLGLTYHNPGFSSPDQLSEPIYRRVRDLLASPINEPILLHCASGNRVGAVWMAHRVLNHNVPYDQALEEAKAIGMKPQAFEPKVKELIESKPE